MTFLALLDTIRERALDVLRTWGPGARGSWCRAQRRRLAERRSVVWVRGAPAISWAEWGGRHGYFDVDYMDGIAYLRPLPGARRRTGAGGA